MKGSFYALYKPVGISSFKYIAQFKRENEIKKIGHMGTLDPLAEGILPVATEEATRLIQYADLLPKVYECEIYFGAQSKTLDREPFLNEDGSLGDLPKCEQNFDKLQLEEKLSKYLGKIKQRPPIFSAVYIDGKRAYDLARKGKIEETQIKEREVECFEISLIDFVWPVARIHLKVGKGFYVRSLIRDLAKDLEAPAFMLSLRRLQVGVFKGKSSEGGLGEIDLSWQKVLQNQTVLELSETESRDLRNGKPIENRFEIGEPKFALDGWQVVFGRIGESLVSVLQLDEESNMLRPKNNFIL